MQYKLNATVYTPYAINFHAIEQMPLREQALYQFRRQDADENDYLSNLCRSHIHVKMFRISSHLGQASARSLMHVYYFIHSALLTGQRWSARDHGNA